MICFDSLVAALKRQDAKMKARDCGIAAKTAYELASPAYSWTDLEKASVEAGVQLHKKVISFSLNVSVPVTPLCRNRCAYCGFVRQPSGEEEAIMAPEAAMELLDCGAQSRCTEALFLLGERPESAAPCLREKLARWGFCDMIHYLSFLCEKALDKGLLPHTNAGLLDAEELALLQPKNASMGLMLESVSQRLFRPGGAHEFSPGKRPALRIAYIEEAGRQGIPFTTGILAGIGETARERTGTLLAIRALHRKYGHIQEVIIQNFCAKKGSPMEGRPEPQLPDMLKTVALARLIFGPDMNIQVPPNLMPPGALPLFARVGANDFGGISPLTTDAVNPEKPWPQLNAPGKGSAYEAFVFKERLPVYPDFITMREKYPDIRRKIAEKIDSQGYVKAR
jgi:FO synthase